MVCCDKLIHMVIMPSCLSTRTHDWSHTPLTWCAPPAPKRASTPRRGRLSCASAIPAWPGDTEARHGSNKLLSRCRSDRTVGYRICLPMQSHVRRSQLAARRGKRTSFGVNKPAELGQCLCRERSCHEFVFGCLRSLHPRGVATDNERVPRHFASSSFAIFSPFHTIKRFRR